MNMIKRNNFKLFDVGESLYVFLTGSQQVMKVTNSQMSRYFNAAMKGMDSVPDMDESIAAELTKELIELRDSVVIKDTPSSEFEQVMLTLNTTHGCNMACRYCFASTDNDRRKVMPAKVARKSVENLLMQYPEAKRYMIYFFGGEPLLHKLFIKDTVAMVKEVFKDKQDKSFGFLINTNGLLINNDDLLEFFKENNFNVTVSIDGLEEINDSNRVLLNGSGSFKMIMRGIEALKKAKVNFNLRATISPMVKNLLEVFRFFESLEAPYAYSFTIITDKKNKKETKFTEEELRALGKQYAEVTDFLADKVINGEKVYCTDFIERLSILEHRWLRTHGCEAGRSALIVDENGDYYPCQNMLPMNVWIGNVEIGVDKELAEGYRSQFIDDLWECRKCWARYLCGGGCQADRRLYKWDFPDDTPQHCVISLFEWEQTLKAFVKIKR